MLQELLTHLRVGPEAFHLFDPLSESRDPRRTDHVTCLELARLVYDPARLVFNRCKNIPEF